MGKRRPDETEEEWRIRQAEQTSEYMRRWREKNKERVSEYNRAYQAMRQQDPEFRAKKTAYAKTYANDPENKVRSYNRRHQVENMARNRANKQAEFRAKRAAKLEALGNPTQCQIRSCGRDLTPTEGQRDPRRIEHRHDTGEVRGVTCDSCNRYLSALDLRYTNPELYADLMAWSNRGAPVVAVEPVKAHHRKMPKSHPTLFGPPVEGDSEE